MAKLELNAADFVVLTAHAVELYLKLLQVTAAEAGRDRITRADLERHSFTRDPGLVAQLKKLAES